MVSMGRGKRLDPYGTERSAVEYKVKIFVARR